MSKTSAHNLTDFPEKSRPPRYIPPLSQEPDNPQKTEKGEKEKEEWPLEEEEEKS